MEMSKFKVGMRVITEHGTGVIDNQELANDAWPGQPKRMVLTGRWGVKLDDGHTWAIKDKIAYYNENEMVGE